MTNEEDYKNTSGSPPISSRSKVLRKMLSISYKEVSAALDLSKKEIERAENLRPPAIKSGDKKYLLETYDSKKTRFGIRELDLYSFDGIDLLLKELKSTYDYVGDFCTRIRLGKELHDEFDNVS